MTKVLIYANRFVVRSNFLPGILHCFFVHVISPAKQLQILHSTWNQDECSIFFPANMHESYEMHGSGWQFSIRPDKPHLQIFKHPFCFSDTGIRTYEFNGTMYVDVSPENGFRSENKRTFRHCQETCSYLTHIQECIRIPFHHFLTTGKRQSHYKGVRGMVIWFYGCQNDVGDHWVQCTV